jgi:hypothetical protein
MDKKEIQELISEIRENLFTADATAENLRDLFSSLPCEMQQQFKQPCNEIRKLLYQAQTQESKLRGLVNTSQLRISH